ncbi:MAG: Hsp20/alpha crystallin family protein [Candidatus Altiarchaeota archaeon]
MDDQKASREHRYMVEEITVTPFFKRHRGHMPATIKLRAEIKEAGSDIVLEADVRGYEREDVEVSASPDSIHLDLILERADSGNVRFHNSYATPAPIDPARLNVEHGTDGRLRVTVAKK